MRRASSEASLSWPIGLALIVTAVFLISYVCLASGTSVQDGIEATRFAHFLRGSPNEIGDTLAGFFGSLTLIWVIASVFQQSMELRAQRNEFSEMVKAQEQQVRALKAQTDLLALETELRKQSEADKELDVILREFLRWSNEGNKLRFRVFKESENGERKYEGELSFTDAFEGHGDENHTLSSAFKMARSNYDYIAEKRFEVTGADSEAFDKCISRLESVMDIEPRVSVSRKRQLTQDRFSDLLSVMREIRADSRFFPGSGPTP